MTIDTFISDIAKESKMLQEMYTQSIYLLTHWEEETNKAAKLYAEKAGREPMTKVEKQQAWLDYLLAKGAQ